MIPLAVNLIILFIVALISTAVNSLNIESVKIGEQINEAVNIEIKVFGKDGMEWTVKGESLNIEEPVVYFGKPSLVLNGYIINADFAEVDRIKKTGRVEGNIKIFGENFRAETDEMFLDMNNNILKGKGEIKIVKGDHVIRGKGFILYLNPFKAIINRADVVYTD